MSLTPRQLACLRAAANGHTYTEIATQLHISESTIKHDIMTMRNALGANSTAHAVHLAHLQGLLGQHGGGNAMIAQILGRIADQLGYDIALLPHIVRSAP